jgi:hypothetical protein
LDVRDAGDDSGSESDLLVSLLDVDDRSAGLVSMGDEPLGLLSDVRVSDVGLRNGKPTLLWSSLRMSSSFLVSFVGVAMLLWEI